MSRDPLLLGSLKGQDIAKFAIIILMIIGICLISAQIFFPNLTFGSLGQIGTFFKKIFDIHMFTT